MSASEAPALRIAGYPAVWTHLDLNVEDEMAAAVLAETLSLYAIDQPEAWIDSQALLREREIADPPYWAIVWTGARAIAAALLSGPALHGVRVLDLGCGLGLSGHAAAAGGAMVLFADYLDEPLQFVRASIAAARIADCQVERIDFTRDRLEQQFDLILAADIVYDPSHYEPLATFLDAHLAGDGRVLLTESLRADARVFLGELKERGFEDRVRPMWVLEDGRRERTWLHELRKEKGVRHLPEKGA